MCAPWRAVSCCVVLFRECRAVFGMWWVSSDVEVDVAEQIAVRLAVRIDPQRDRDATVERAGAHEVQPFARGVLVARDGASDERAELGSDLLDGQFTLECLPHRL